jgi:DNA-binding protein H-NS
VEVDDLWRLHEQVASTLARKIADETAKLEEKLRSVELTKNAMTSNRSRRPYPKVVLKYQNPKNPAETCSGRGKQPNWAQPQLKAGMKLEDLIRR